MQRQYYLLDVFTDRPPAGNPLAAARHTVTIAQGEAPCRPSTIVLARDDGRLAEAAIAGAAVIVAEGKINL